MGDDGYAGEDRPGEIPPAHRDTRSYCSNCMRFLDEQLVLECPQCLQLTTIQRLDPSRKLILVREGQRGARKFRDYDKLGQALSQGSVHPEDVYCELVGETVPGTRCSMHTQLEWTPVKDCRAFAVRGLVAPPATGISGWFWMGGILGGCLGVLVVLLVFLFSSDFPVPGAHPPFWEKLVLLIGVVLLIAGHLKESCGMSLAGLLVAGAMCVLMEVEWNPDHLAIAITFTAAAFAVVFGLVIGSLCWLIGLVVERRRRLQLPRVER